MVTLDFSKCKTIDDVNRIFERKKEKLEEARNNMKILLNQGKLIKIK